MNWKLYLKAGRIKIEHFGREYIVGHVVHSCCISSEDMIRGLSTVTDQNDLRSGYDSFVPPLSSYIFSIEP